MLDNVPISNLEIYEINEIVDSADSPVVLLFLERQGTLNYSNYLATLFAKISILDECQISAAIDRLFVKESKPKQTSIQTVL